MAENLVRTFGRYPDYASFNFEMFNRMNRKALAMLNSLQTILSNPELGEDYFGMLIRFLNYCP